MKLEQFSEDELIFMKDLVKTHNKTTPIITDGEGKALSGLVDKISKNIEWVQERK